MKSDLAFVFNKILLAQTVKHNIMTIRDDTDSENTAYIMYKSTFTIKDFQILLFVKIFFFLNYNIVFSKKHIWKTIKCILIPLL